MKRLPLPRPRSFYDWIPATLSCPFASPTLCPGHFIVPEQRGFSLISSAAGINVTSPKLAVKRCRINENIVWWYIYFCNKQTVKVNLKNFLYCKNKKDSIIVVSKAYFELLRARLYFYYIKISLLFLNNKISSHICNPYLFSKIIFSPHLSLPIEKKS